MKTLVMAGLPIALLMPLVATAQSDFDGTWKIDLSKTIVPAKPDVFQSEGRRLPM
jgi:hypothetical protein